MFNLQLGQEIVEPSIPGGVRGGLGYASSAVPYNTMSIVDIHIFLSKVTMVMVYVLMLSTLSRSVCTFCLFNHVNVIV